MPGEQASCGVWCQGGSGVREVLEFLERGKTYLSLTQVEAWTTSNRFGHTLVYLLLSHQSSHPPSNFLPVFVGRSHCIDTLVGNGSRNPYYSSPTHPAHSTSSLKSRPSITPSRHIVSLFVRSQVLDSGELRVKACILKVGYRDRLIFRRTRMSSWSRSCLLHVSRVSNSPSPSSSPRISIKRPSDAEQRKGQGLQLEDPEHPHSPMMSDFTLLLVWFGFVWFVCLPVCVFVRLWRGVCNVG